MNDKVIWNIRWMGEGEVISLIEKETNISVLLDIQKQLMEKGISLLINWIGQSKQIAPGIIGSDVSSEGIETLRIVRDTLTSRLKELSAWDAEVWEDDRIRDRVGELVKAD